VCSRLRHLGLYKRTLMFTQWRICLTMHFSEHIPIIKQSRTIITCWKRLIRSQFKATKVQIKRYLAHATLSLFHMRISPNTLSAWTPHPTQNYSQRAGGVAQVVDHLPIKCEALSSNPNSTKKPRTNLFISCCHCAKWSSTLLFL
jgi:hypothetical protein